MTSLQMIVIRLMGVRAWLLYTSVLAVSLTASVAGYFLMSSGTAQHQSKRSILHHVSEPRASSLSQLTLKKDREQPRVENLAIDDSSADGNSLEWLPKRSSRDIEDSLWANEPVNAAIKHVSDQSGEHQLVNGVANSTIDRSDRVSPDTTLLDIALGDTTTDSPGSSVISFTYTPMSIIHFLADPAILSSQTVVYTHIELAQDCTSCVLKWEHQDSEEIEFLFEGSLLAGQVRTVFVTPAEGWKIGTYMLSAYDLNKAGEMIASNTIRIAGINNELASIMPPVEFIQSLLDSGLAAAKQP